MRIDVSSLRLPSEVQTACFGVASPSRGDAKIFKFAERAPTAEQDAGVKTDDAQEMERTNRRRLMGLLVAQFGNLIDHCNLTIQGLLPTARYAPEPETYGGIRQLAAKMAKIERRLAKRRCAE